MMTETTRPTTFTESWTCAIRTRYYGPTDRRGSRIVAWRADVGSYREDRNRENRGMWVQVPYDHALGITENHAAAVAAYVEKRNAAGDDWSGDWIVGAGERGYYAVRTPPGFQPAS